MYSEHSTLTVTWNAVPGALSYRLYRGTMNSLQFASENTMEDNLISFIQVESHDLESEFAEDLDWFESEESGCKSDEEIQSLTLKNGDVFFINGKAFKYVEDSTWGDSCHPTSIPPILEKEPSEQPMRLQDEQRPLVGIATTYPVPTIGELTHTKIFNAEGWIDFGGVQESPSRKPLTVKDLMNIGEPGPVSIGYVPAYVGDATQLGGILRAQLGQGLQIDASGAISISAPMSGTLSISTPAAQDTIAYRTLTLRSHEHTGTACLNSVTSAVSGALSMFS